MVRYITEFLIPTVSEGTREYMTTTVQGLTKNEYSNSFIIKRSTKIKKKDRGII